MLLYMQGEKIEIYEDTLITGKINPGAIVQVYAKLYVMQGVFGIIEGQSEEACISSQRFKNATIAFWKIYTPFYNFRNVTCLL